MAPHLFPIFSFFSIIITFFLAHVPTSVLAIDEQYLNCVAPFHCANIQNISYPFWGSSRSKYCGYPGYKLECGNDVPEINIMDMTYRVLDINSATGILTVAREDYWDDNCPADLVNQTLNSSLFNYTFDTENITLYYNCPPLMEEISAALLPFKFNCSSDETDSNNYYFIWGSNIVNRNLLTRVKNYLVSCTTNVTIPVRQSTFLLLMSHPTSVKLNEALKDGFELHWYANNSLCNQCKQSGGLCGYDTNAGGFICYCSDKPYSLTCSSKGGGNKVKILVGAVIGSAGFGAIALVCIFLILRQRRKIAAQSKSKDLLQTPPSSTSATSTTYNFSRSIGSYPYSMSDLEKGSTYFGTQVFTYAELEEVTNNFDPSKELGDGGFGTVYHGVLKDGRAVAVKRLYENTVKRVEQFKNEIEILTRLRHPNLVTLYGCTSRHSRELLLVYEYIPNGTVADHLHGSQSNSGFLTWPIRLSIAVETAVALTYLHAKDVIHRDVKTNNILLDNDFHVKVADFGLSRFFPTDVTHVSTAPQGTPGYVDPEYYQCYQLTEKSDVYSFGVVLIELISSLEAVDTNRHRHDINLANMAISRIQNHSLKELIDPCLGFEKDYAVRNMITSVAELAFRCLQQDREMRPSMQEALEVLKEIQNQQIGAQKAEVVDFCSTDDVVLLKNVPPPISPDSGTGATDKWVSSSTPPSSF